MFEARKSSMVVAIAVAAGGCGVGTVGQPAGGEGQSCRDGGGCDAGLVCLGQVCVDCGSCASGCTLQGDACVATAAPCADATVLCVDDTAGSTQEYATIQAAADASAPGDTVLVFPGTYAGFAVRTSGTPARRIVYRANGAVTIASDQRGSSTDWARDAGVFLSGASYVTIDGFAFVAGVTRCIAAGDNDPSSPAMGDEIVNNTCTGASEGGLYFSHMGSSLIERNTVHDVTGSHGLYLANAGSDGTVIRGNTIYNVDPAGADHNCIHLNGDSSSGGDGIISNVTIEGNTLHDCVQHGIDADGVQDSTIANNLIYGNGSDGVVPFQIDGAAGPQDLVVVNNTIDALGGSCALEFDNDLGGHTVFNNILLSTAAGCYAGGTSNYRGTSVAGLFVDPAHGDYHLQPYATDLVDTGVESASGHAAPTRDIEGNTRPRGTAVDLGALEAVGSMSGTTDFSFIVFGDLNGGNCDRNDRLNRLVGHMATERDVAFFVQTGDVIDGYVSGNSAMCFGAEPSTALGLPACGPGIPNGNLHDILAPLRDRAPADGLATSYFQALGNHDDNWGDGWYPDPCGGGICAFLSPLAPHELINHSHTAADATAFDQGICSTTRASSTLTRDFYYSFAFGNSYFIVLRLNNDYYNMISSCNLADCPAYCSDPAHVSDPRRTEICWGGIAQWDWLVSELDTAQGAYDHIFVFAHAPLLGSGDNHGPTAGAEHFRALLESHGVDVYFNGHNHAYERTHRVRGSSIDPTGTAYITVGPGGATIDGTNGAWFTEVGSDSFGSWNEEEHTTYLKIHVSGATVSGQLYSLGLWGAPVDTFTY